MRPTEQFDTSIFPTHVQNIFKLINSIQSKLFGINLLTYSIYYRQV